MDYEKISSWDEVVTVVVDPRISQLCAFEMGPILWKGLSREDRPVPD